MTRRAVGRLLVVSGTLALVYAIAIWGYGFYERTERARELPIATATWTPARGDTLGLLEIPGLDLSVAVIEGDDERSLRGGVGHLVDTPLPWDVGNSVLAGHRDTDFRPLKRIRVGDPIRFRLGNRSIDYIVRETQVVNATDLGALQPTSMSTLTLITCYPFGYVGPAPKRFIVRAERIYRADWPVQASLGS